MDFLFFFVSVISDSFYINIIFLLSVISYSPKCLKKIYDGLAIVINSAHDIIRVDFLWTVDVYVCHLSKLEPFKINGSR